MKIIYLFRSKLHYGYSIENVFSTIIKNIQKSYEIQIFNLPKTTTSILNIVKNICFLRKIPKNGIVHITGDIHYVALFLKRKRTVLTIHDLVSVKNNKGLKKFIIDLFWYRLPLLKLKYITVVSEKTKKELVNRYPFAKNKIIVIENPVDDRFVFEVKNIDKNLPILLQIGTTENKNLIRIIKAIRDIRCKLYIIGKLNNEQKETLEKYKINYENSYNLSEEEIVEKYRQADIILFASTYEGFGMPIIEGQAVGRAVITSNISPMKEVADGGAHLVDPFSELSIKKGILKLLNDDNYRNKIIERGLINSKKYSSEKIAQKYEKLYKTIMKGSNND